MTASSKAALKPVSPAWASLERQAALITHWPPKERKPMAKDLIRKLLNQLDAK